MKILLFGANGQVGWELQRSLAVLGELVALGSDSAHNPEGLCGDFTNLAGLAHTVQHVRPAVIVNAAAHTAVDKAESEPERARTINALAPAVLAQEANALGACLVHYSTDYVFDGSGDAPWKESDATAPLNVYGRTKREGELAVARTAKHLIFRTSWVYGARGDNFAKTMLRLASQRDTLSVIDDQIGAPTSAELLADVTAHALPALLANPALAGLYHCVAAGHTSWCTYARYVLEVAAQTALAPSLKATAVHAIASSAYPKPAARPLNSRLDNVLLQRRFGMVLPSWQTGVRRMVMEIAAPYAL